MCCCGCNISCGCIFPCLPPTVRLEWEKAFAAVFVFVTFVLQVIVNLLINIVNAIMRCTFGGSPRHGCLQLCTRMSQAADSGQHATADSAAESAAAARAASEAAFLQSLASKNTNGFTDATAKPGRVGGVDVAWQRVSSPSVLWGSEGAGPRAVQQGALGDCYALAAFSALAEQVWSERCRCAGV